MKIDEMKKMFYETFGEGGDLRVFTSPGRVNLIGEHIDYCGGCVLPAALTMKTTIIARKRDDDIIRLKATDLDILEGGRNYANFPVIRNHHYCCCSDGPGNLQAEDASVHRSDSDLFDRRLVLGYC